MAKPFEVTDGDFSEKVLNGSRPVVVDFWAEWCPPCRLIEPILEELASEYDGRMDFARLNVDSNAQTALQYGIRSIPTLIFFDKGKPASQVVGAVPKSMLKKRIDSILQA